MKLLNTNKCAGSFHPKWNLREDSRFGPWHRNSFVFLCKPIFFYGIALITFRGAVGKAKFTVNIAKWTKTICRKKKKNPKAKRGNDVATTSENNLNKRNAGRRKNAKWRNRRWKKRGPRKCLKKKNKTTQKNGGLSIKQNWNEKRKPGYLDGRKKKIDPKRRPSFHNLKRLRVNHRSLFFFLWKRKLTHRSKEWDDSHFLCDHLKVPLKVPVLERPRNVKSAIELKVGKLRW